jgi:hypothetical protein
MIGAEQVGGTVRLTLSTSKPLLLSPLLGATDTRTVQWGGLGERLLSYMKTLS